MPLFSRSILIAAGLLLATPAFAQSALTLKLADPAWDGASVPAGQQCKLQGGDGATPTLSVSGLPDGTATVTLAFNDETYKPMDDGGHGILAFAVTPEAGAATLPSAPGNSTDLPAGVTVAKASRGTGDYASPGYLPPCSGGRGNTYSVTATALDAAGAELAKGEIEIGKY